MHSLLKNKSALLDVLSSTRQVKKNVETERQMYLDKTGYKQLYVQLRKCALAAEVWQVYRCRHRVRRKLTATRLEGKDNGCTHRTEWYLATLDTCHVRDVKYSLLVVWYKSLFARSIQTALTSLSFLDVIILLWYLYFSGVARKRYIFLVTWATAAEFSFA